MFQLIMGDVGAAASGAKTVPYHPLRVYGCQDRLSVLKSTQTRLSQPPQELDVASASRLEAVEQMYHQLQVQVKELHQAVDILATHTSTLTSLLERNATPQPASPSSTQNMSLLESLAGQSRLPHSLLHGFGGQQLVPPPRHPKSNAAARAAKAAGKKPTLAQFQHQARDGLYGPSVRMAAEQNQVKEIRASYRRLSEENLLEGYGKPEAETEETGYGDYF